MVEVSATIGALIVRAAVAAGASAEALRAATGFDPAIATDADARIPLATETVLWDEAARLTRDEAFGLHAAEGLRPGVLDVLDYVVRAAPTIRASLDRLARYNRLLHDVAMISMIDRDEVTRVEHTLHGMQQSRHAAEFTIASIVVVGAQMCGAQIPARSVEFRHAAPRSLDEHLRIFGVTPRFACEVNAIEIDRSVVDDPVASADPGLLRVVERHAAALLAERPEPGETTSNRVRRILAEVLGEGEGDGTLAAIAAKLKMSERSLQRRLTDEGITFDALLDDLRRSLAIRFMGDTKIAIAEVAYLLGYSEPSAFHRAFKRWTGTTPSELRRRA